MPEKKADLTKKPTWAWLCTVAPHINPFPLWTPWLGQLGLVHRGPPFVSTAVHRARLWLKFIEVYKQTQTSLVWREKVSLCNKVRPAIMFFALIDMARMSWIHIIILRIWHHQLCVKVTIPQKFKKLQLLEINTVSVGPPSCQKVVCFNVRPAQSNFPNSDAALLFDNTVYYICFLTKLNWNCPKTKWQVL